MNITDRIHWIGGIAPNADFAAGTVNTDIVECAGEGLLGIVWYGTNASSGASTLTVDACDNTTPSNTTAVAFQYRVSTTFDTWGSWTQATTAGFTVGGSADSMWQIYVPAAELAGAGYAYGRITMVESTNQAADGMVLLGVVNPRDMQAVPYSMID
jgi:hypothetical protein